MNNRVLLYKSEPILHPGEPDGRATRSEQTYYYNATGEGRRADMMGKAVRINGEEAGYVTSFRYQTANDHDFSRCEIELTRYPPIEPDVGDGEPFWAGGDVEDMRIPSIEFRLEALMNTGVSASEAARRVKDAFEHLGVTMQQCNSAVAKFARLANEAKVEAEDTAAEEAKANMQCKRRIRLRRKRR